VFVEASVALFVGLAALNLALSTSGERTSAINPLSEQLADSPTETVLRIVAFPALETLFWQALFFEGFARLGLSRWVPLLLSALLFAVVLHWQRGGSAMVGAFVKSGCSGPLGQRAHWSTDLPASDQGWFRRSSCLSPDGVRRFEPT
jgi:hypothetical protein